ncbi:AN1-type zinc finger protein 2A-like, partial [Scleropages formosus]
MEFPELGEHCSEKSCKRLDFLPMKCDACEEIFCKDHITYANHKCTSSYKKDIQVPVCPLCNTPIPIKRGEMPDIKVGQHMDRDCKSDPAQRKRKSQGMTPSSTAASSSRGSSRSVPNGLNSPRTQHVSVSRSHSAADPNPSMPSMSGQNVISPSLSLQAGMTEEQALQRALEISLAESACGAHAALSPQEQEDLALAQALAASEEDYRRQQHRQQ